MLEKIFVAYLDITDKDLSSWKIQHNLCLNKTGNPLVALWV
jgi:hypothetical protein